MKKKKKICEICGEEYVYKLKITRIKEKEVCEHDGEIKHELYPYNVPLTKV